MRLFKRTLILGFICAICFSAPRLNVRLTATPGTPINIASQFNHPSGPLYASKVFIQMAVTSTTGVGYVMDLSGLAPGTTPNKSNGNQVVAQLQSATSTAPGGNYYDLKTPEEGNGIDLEYLFVDADAASPMIVSVVLR